ncbi:MAG: hypothetical protein FWC89_06985 [Defluviitaleaceae bacterium]|nr:hypothetical protein [Defluviitaleaceae bacterium]
MATSDFAQNTVICSKGEPLRQLLIVRKGTIEANLGGHMYRFGQGDLLGLDAITTGSHGLTYTAASEDVSVFTHPYEDISTLETLLRENEEISNMVLNSMCRQMVMFLQYRATLKTEATRAYGIISQAYPLYEKLCNRFAFTAKKLPAVAGVTSPAEIDNVPDWVQEYYYGIKDLDPAIQKGFFAKKGIAMGFILGCSEEIVRILDASSNYQKYIEINSKVILSPTGFDLYSLISELHMESAGIGGADAAIDTLMNPMTAFLSNSVYVDQNNFKNRQAAYKEGLAKRGGRSAPVSADGTAAPQEKKNLADSVGTILKYAGYPEDQSNKFARLIIDYTKMPDRGSSDDVVHRMRRELTNMFNEIYKKALINSLNDTAVPTVIKMFLNFGYMDAALAGYENADYLYSIADSMTGDPERGVYTAAEWLKAIYRGQKEPCRNEFDQDYPAYIAELKQQKRFDKKEEERLLADCENKLMFEIDNIFPVVNKLTFGRITTFCPIFSDNNVQRGLEASLITPDLIRQTFGEITAVDFSAFYRETMFSNAEIGVPRETVHVEVMPEVILMPNVGVRGIMWQDIEGRKRTTPARMFAPLFLLVDLKPLLVRLTGEFRWEMCKRVQGSRWQDVTEPSLTSEYCDYLQFYKHNRDLSTEIKATVKQELTRARNNYKNVFVQNYTEWVLFEANGSPRINRFARRLLMTYSPFALSIRQGLAQNPQYAEPLKRFNFKNQQREHHLSRLIQKLNQTGMEVPQELKDELKFVKS